MGMGMVWIRVNRKLMGYEATEMVKRLCVKVAENI